MISRLGQSQTEREPSELAPHYVDVDERTPRDLLLFAREFARQVHFEPDPKGPAPATDDWTPFFTYGDADAAQLPERIDGSTSPHLALLIAFLKLYEIPRAQLNTLTGR